MANEYKHIFLHNVANAESFTGHRPPPFSVEYAERDRTQHGPFLINRFRTIAAAMLQERDTRKAASIPTRNGNYFEFESEAGFPLLTKSLDSPSKGIRLLNIHKEPTANGEITKAIVYVPRGKERIFLKKVEEYSNPEKDKVKNSGDSQDDEPIRTPKNAPLITSIRDVKLAVMESFWPPNEIGLVQLESPIWCEAWIRILESERESDFSSQIEFFKITLERIGIEFKENIIHFPERAILLIKANRTALMELVMQTDQLAELRIAQEVAGFWTRKNSRPEQREWIGDLLRRIEFHDSSIKVCILDSGVDNGHPLLQSILEDRDCLTIDPTWGTADVSAISGFGGHGTLMAGIVGFGDLQLALEGQGAISLRHRLCSVKLLPRTGQSPKELWGDFTSQAVSRAEQVNADQFCIFCMAVTASEDVDRGKPSSWSGAIDKLAFGDETIKRLIIISGGNINDPEYWSQYPIQNRDWSIQNPAQSWNALTIGAFTEKVRILDERYQGYSAVAPFGGLSPFSSTSNLWERRKWPIKPEVVFEGGNVSKSMMEDAMVCDQHEDLEILSTSKNFAHRYFDTFGGTSPSAAKAAWLAAQVASRYPNAWPETIRGLIVHSATWTDAMLAQFQVNLRSKTSVHDLLRTCGYGVPNVNRALNSFENAFTFIAQEEIQPFAKESGKRPSMNEMHLYDLPWPQELLLSLGATSVTMKVTLSYFIEPGPGEIGWKDRYRYPSFALRFDVNNVGEEEAAFRRRVNAEALEEGERRESNSGSGRWRIGSDTRGLGSIHSDYWEGTGADLAVCNKIAIFPVIGWWREREYLGKYDSLARYSLIVSLETPTESVELYSTVKTIIEASTTISIDA